MRLLARVVVALRWLVVPAWVAAAVWATVALPAIDEATSSDLGSLLPSDSAALQAELASREAFPLPLRGQAVLVEPDPDQGAIAQRALDLRDGAVPGVLGGLPITDALLLQQPPGQARVALTTLYLPPDASIFEQWQAAERVRAAAGPQARLTGVVPSRTSEGDVILSRIHLVEGATALVVALLVGFHFRALGAPLLALATVAVAYGLSSRLAGAAAGRLELSVPGEVRPVIVVLVFGVTTDYVLFLLAAFRRELAAGVTPAEAAMASLATLGGPIAAAGLAVVGATGVLVAGELELLRGFGPGMALAVLVSLLVSLTFVPCAAALLGRFVLWPRGPGVQDERLPRGWGAKIATRVPMLVVVPCLVLLFACAAGLGKLTLGEPLVSGLPPSTGPSQAEAIVDRTLPAGTTSPTEVLLRGEGVAADEPALARLGALLREREGVALVVSPDDLPTGWPQGLLRREDGRAARFVLAFDAPALGATATGDLRELRSALPGLVEQAGLGRPEVLVAGDTALSAATIDRAVDDLLQVAPLAVLMVVLVLVVLLRAVLAPLYLVAAGLLAPAAALGAATWFFVVLLGQDGLSWLVPVASCVLLLSLGADYTVVLAGRIWKRVETRDGRVRDAVAQEAAAASRPIRTAAIVLAASFALLALVPLRSFQQIAFTVTVGLLLDAFVVRSLLVPALIVLFGGGRRFRRAAAREATPVPAPRQ